MWYHRFLVEASYLLAAIGYLPQPQQEQVLLAVKRAEKFHEGQQRDSGEPYITHPLAVAEYLARLEASATTLKAALLHDVVEDSHTTLEEVEREFGKEVAHLVDGVTKLSHLRYEGKREQRQVASLRKLLLTAHGDLRVILIKLADRWHNIETIQGLRADKRDRVALETLDIYVPFARLAGLWDMKSRFEEVCFPIAMPNEYALWHEKIAQVREAVAPERQAFIARVNMATKEDVHGEIQYMTDYEIYSKLQGNLHRLKDVQNVDTALILLLGTIQPMECYRVLGEIHALYPTSSLSFRDYINAPQPNGYRALHTTIFLGKEHRLRLRIQTNQMYEYVAKRKFSSWVPEEVTDIYSALGLLLKATFEEQQYLKDLRETILKERMNVFTSSGDVITLPQHATGVDFAFRVNPDHISYLQAIRVNGNLREATHILQEGDVVELVLAKNGAGTNGTIPTIWVDKVKSVDAREKLRQSLGQSPFEDQVIAGSEILNQELQKRRLPRWWLFHLNKIQSQLAQKMGKASFDDLLSDVGTGLLSASKVIDEYILMLQIPSIWTTRILHFFHLLPRSRVLDKEAKVMDIEVYAEDRKGLIHDVTGCFAERDINIAKFEVFAVPPKDALYKIRLEVKNFDTFSDLYDALVQIHNVKQVLRKK